MRPLWVMLISITRMCRGETTYEVSWLSLATITLFSTCYIFCSNLGRRYGISAANHNASGDLIRSALAKTPILIESLITSAKLRFAHDNLDEPPPRCKIRHVVTTDEPPSRSRARRMLTVMGNSVSQSPTYTTYI